VGREKVCLGQLPFLKATVARSSIIGRARSPICYEITNLILDYLTEDLDPETVSAFEEHLRNCTDSAAFLNTYKKTVQLTESFLRERTKRVR
jgi:hypothetical protein